MINIDMERLEEERRHMNTPIDFLQLESDGVLEKVSARRYKIINIEKLPIHARKQIKSLETGPKGCIVQFYKKWDK